MTLRERLQSDTLTLADMRVRMERELSGSPTDLDMLQWLAGDDQSLHLLAGTVNHDLQVERVVSAVRSRLLEIHLAGQLSQAQRALCLAMAHQALNNEHVVAVSARDAERLDALGSGVAASQAEATNRRELDVIVWAMFRHPAASRWASQLASMPIDRCSEDLRQLLVRAFVEPAIEAGLAAALPNAGPIHDPTSNAVRQMYEQHPYPRWLQVTPSGRTTEEQVQRLLPGFSWPEPTGRRRLLVAGCGTGFHAIRVALDNPSAEVCGLDLSRTSLGYAARKANELRLHNLRWRHGDLLHLDDEMLWDHIDCIGVLHHLRDRQAAWRGLARALRRGGTLQIGVYSRVGRLLFERLRGTQPSPPLSEPDAVQQHRARLIEDPRFASARAQLSQYDDFFTTSMVRDLLFHVYEQPYTLAELESAAHDAGVRLLAAHVPPAIRRAVQQRDPESRWPVTTFARWQEIESAYAGTALMFQCWLQRPPG